MITRQFLKEKKGIIISDAMIAILIFLLFTGIIIAIITNIIKESTKIKMYSQHTDIAIKIFEHIEEMPFESVTTEELENYINTINPEHISAGANINELTTPYKIMVEVENYNETEGNTNKIDVLKIVSLTIESNIQLQPHQTQISRLKRASFQDIKSALSEQ